MTPRGAQALSAFLRTSHNMTSLAVIDRSENATTTTKASTMQTIYLEGIQHFQGIQKLILNGIVGDVHVLVTTLLPQLCALNITAFHLLLAEVELLTRGLLSHAHQLRKLSLDACLLDDVCMSVLSPVLGNHPSIKSVSLNDSYIGDAGISSFVEHWSPVSKIEELSLATNDIGPKGAHLLINALSNNHSTLCWLDLGNNKFIGFEGLRLIGKALSGIKLPALDIHDVVSWTEYEDDACDAAVIQETKRMAAGKALLDGVRDNVHLLEMGSDGFHLPDIVVDEIYLYIDANALGRRAVLEQSHALPRGVWSHFLAKEGMSSSLVNLFLRELPGVVMGGSRNNTIGRKRCRYCYDNELIVDVIGSRV